MSSSPGASSSKDGPTATPPALPEAAATSASGALDGTGMALVVGCYCLWGFFPLYFHLLSAAGSVEIIGHRIVWTLVTCLALIALRRRWAQLVHVVRSPRLLGMLAVCGLLVSVNWLVYVYGVNTARTADAALGYFINPLVTVALAALVLHERLRPAHRVSIALAGAGVALLVVLQGSLPWISLALAFSFANVSGGEVTLEAPWSPIALVAANLFVVAFGATWGPLVWVLLGEMFPNRIRAGALAVAAAAQWVANFFISTTFPSFSSISLTFAYGFYAVFALLSLLFVFFRVPETKGKELEEMEDLAV